MPDNRSACAKCGQIYGEPYAPQCDCFKEVSLQPLFNPGACAEICSHCGYEKPIGGHCICQVERKEMLEIKNLVQNVKDSNPKDSVGTKKVPFSTVSAPVIAEIGLAMLEGSRKYGRHNYRAIGVRGSVYYDACLRHLTQWWEGEDIDPDSGLSHIVKAAACLIVLRDAMLLDKVADDRPPKTKQGWVQELNKKAAEIIEKYPNALEPYTEISENERKTT
jgi:hypothetical protein